MKVRIKDEKGRLSLSLCVYTPLFTSALLLESRRDSRLCQGTITTITRITLIEEGNHLRTLTLTQFSFFTTSTHPSTTYRHVKRRKKHEKASKQGAHKLEEELNE